MNLVILNDSRATSAEQNSTQEATTAAAKTDDIDADVAAAKTIGELMKLAGAEQFQSATNEKTYVYVFSYKDIYYRAIAVIPKDVSEEDSKLDASEKDYAEKHDKLMGALAVDKIENLNAGIPSQEEIDKFIGKTGEELMNEGWSTMVLDAETLLFTMDYKGYAYDIQFEGKAADPENFDEQKDMKNLTAKTFSYTGIGDATLIEEE